MLVRPFSTLSGLAPASESAHHWELNRYPCPAKSLPQAN